MLAVVDINHKQYVVSPDQEIIVDKLEGEKGAKLDFPTVMLFEDKGKIEIGKPYLKYVVQAQITEQAKGEKLQVRRYKQKVRYRRQMGFRPLITKLKILAVSKS